MIAGNGTPHFAMHFIWNEPERVTLEFDFVVPALQPNVIQTVPDQANSLFQRGTDEVLTSSVHYLDSFGNHYKTVYANNALKDYAWLRPPHLRFMEKPVTPPSETV
jgi:hypothetical protein